MIAGAVAGTVEHVAMYPVDTIKTRMQALSHPGQRLHNMSVWGAIHTAVRREGLAALYKGVGAVAGGAGPAHAVHFAVYEAVKQQLGGYRPGHNPLISGVAGAVATAFNDAIMTPADVIKQRLQVVHSPYRGVLDCVRQVYHSEGPAAFFRSYRTTLVMNVPFIAMHFSVYDAAKGLLVGGEDGDEDTLLVQLVAGGVAGGSAAAVTTPFDVVKTRLQTEGVLSARRYNSSAVLPVMRRIVQEEGWSALWRGVRPRVLFNAPSAAICWGTYESIKAFLAR
ncbi:mitochondrial carrier domain-containing protein [Haematococcus lacustris]